MCLIIVAWQCHPEYPLIVAANRDEYYDRPTEPAHIWEQSTDLPTTGPQTNGLLAGRDLTGGGTWLGINNAGKFAAVTNYREGLQEKQLRSRGELTTGFLDSDMRIDQYAQECTDNGTQYNGFNLLLSEADQLVYCSNRHPDIVPLTPGIYTLSNHLLDSPWPKSIHVKDALEPLLSPSNSINVDQLIDCLQRREPFADEHLPDTGVGLELERMLSPPFILSSSPLSNYGTRCTTVVLKNKAGKTQFVEQNYNHDGSAGERKSFRV